MTTPLVPDPAAPPPRSDSDIARDMYDPVGMYETSLKDGVNRLRDEGEVGDEPAALHLAEMSEAFADAGIGPQLAGRLHTLLVHRTLNPADEATQRAEHVEARRYLREKHGSDTEVNRRLAGIKDYLKAHPALHQALEVSRAGSHPDIVRALDEHFTSLRTTPHPRAVKREAAAAAAKRTQASVAGGKKK